jgi:hypothetical protein
VTNLVESTVTEVLIEAADGLVIESVSETLVVETTANGPDILAEVTSTETVTEAATETVYAVVPETFLIDVGEQGPAGIQGPAGGAVYPGKTITYTGSLVTEVRSYLDAAKTMLAERRVLAYVGSVLSSIQFFNGIGNLMKTRTLNYSGSALIGYTET